MMKESVGKDPAADAAVMRRLPRVFLVTPPDETGTASLDSPQSKHLARVLRMGKGDLIGVLDGKGRGWIAEIADSRASTASIVQEVSCTSAPLRRARLALPLLKGERMSFALQKCTELGVSVFDIVPAERATAKLKDADSKSSRFAGVIESAAEQCGAFTLPEVRIWSRLEDYFEQLESPRRFVAWEEHTPGGCARIAEGKDEVALAIGPEGGLSASEVALWQNRGFEPVSLGPRILRAETAAVAIAAIALIGGE